MADGLPLLPLELVIGKLRLRLAYCVPASVKKERSTPVDPEKHLRSRPDAAIVVVSGYYSDFIGQLDMHKAGLAETFNVAYGTAQVTILPPLRQSNIFRTQADQRVAINSWRTMPNIHSLAADVDHC
jgi:hypothetical protein